MTIVELEAIAAQAVRPAGQYSVVAVVDHKPGGRLANGSPSGIGGETRYGAAWFDGLRRSKPIALFARQRDAFTLIDLLTDRTLRSAPRSAAPRSQAEGPAEGGAVRSARSHERSTPPLPDVAEVLTGARGGRTASTTYPTPGSPGAPLCKARGRSLEDLPVARNGQRRQTCDDACRQAFHRGQRAPVSGGRDARVPQRPVTASPPHPRLQGGDRRGPRTRC